MKRFLNLGLVICLMLALCIPVSADNTVQVIGNGNTINFYDVPDNYWAKDEIEYSASQGIVSGRKDGSFAPTEGVTREAFAKMMALTFKAPLASPTEASFTDVPTDKWSYSYIETCKEFLTGYVSPIDGTMSFHPTEYATREDVAVALVRMLGLTDQNTDNPNYAKYHFSDAGNISPSLLPYVSIAAERGLITGFSDGTFGPTKRISRAQTVVLLNRASKQSVTGATSELQVETHVSYSESGNVATLYVYAPEGASVTVDGVATRMEQDTESNSYVGTVVYKFEKEGTKTFNVTATKMGKTKNVTATAQYQIGAPILTITQCPVSATDKNVTIKGTLIDSNSESSHNNVSLTINGKSVNVGYYGDWSASYTLREGDNTFTFVATNEAGKTVTQTKTINFSVGGPSLVITQCPVSVTDKNVTIKGTLKDSNYSVSLTINGKSVSVGYYGDWSASYTLDEGDNTFTFVATNEVGKTVTQTKIITLVVSAPTITFYNCPEETQSSTITIEGAVDGDYDGTRLYLNDQSVSLMSNGDFSKAVSLTEGENTFVFRAVNSMGKETSITKTIVYTATNE